jgi:hypothetical protein
MMSKIQITNEISTRLTGLRNATTASLDFNRARQLTFDDNRRVGTLTEYRNVIRTVGRLSGRYQRTFETDIRNCERIVEHARARDEQLARTIRR